MFSHQPFFLFILAGYVSVIPRANALHISTGYRPFDMIFLNDDDVYDGDFGTAIDFNPRLKEHPFNVTSELKVQDSQSSTKSDKSAESSIYNNLKVIEHSAKPLESNLKLNLIEIDDSGMVSDKALTAPSTTFNTVSKNSKSLDFQDDFIKGLFNSVACMIQGFIDILFGPLPPKINTSKDTVEGKEDNLTQTRKVHKREIGSSDTTIKNNSSTNTDHDEIIQSSSSNIENVNESTINSSAKHEAIAITLLNKTDLMNEVLQEPLDRTHLGDKSSSIAHMDGTFAVVTEHSSNNTESNQESTSNKPTTFSKISFVTHEKENNLVKKKPDMLLDDPFTTQDDPELLDDGIKMADYNARESEKEGNIVVKSSSVGELILITSACVFFVLIFAIGGAALAYMVRQKHLVGNPFGNQTASSCHNTNLAHA